jgi:hypothetical protein
MWNRALASCARTYTDAVLSVVEADGYPCSTRCAVMLDDRREVITFASLPQLASSWRGPASLLFHRHDDRLENQYQLMIRGHLVQQDDSLELRPTHFVTANGSLTGDRMPHAGAPLQLIQFMLLGRRQAARYLRRRNVAWPVDFRPMLRVLRELQPNRG